MALSTQRIQDLKENRVVPIAALYPHARNYKSHPPEQIRKIKASLERWGQVRSIVIKDDANGSYTIVAGHGVVEAAQQLKMSELHADVFPQWVPDEEIRGYLVADNELGNDAQDDSELLAQLLQEQQDAGYDLASMGSDDETLRQMLESLGDEYVGDGEGSEDNATDEQSVKRASLAERFIIPPFSVLDARQGYWQERKRAWLALGIQSELGRGGGITPGDSAEITEPGLNYYRNQNHAAPGGSLRDAMTLGKDGRTVRGDGAGRAIPTPETASLKDGLTFPTSIHPYDKTGAKRNGLLGFSEQARSHYGKGLARTNGQDLMRGEHVVGENKGRLTWVAGNRPDDKLDETSRKNLAAGRKSAARSIHDHEWMADKLGKVQAPDTPQSGTSIFDPVLCELAYSWFSPPHGTVLDPFAGGSVRGIVAAKLGRHYVGIDLRTEQIEANEEQATSILRSHPTLMLDPADVSLDYTPEYTPIDEHGGYLVKRDDLFQIAGVRGGKVRTVWALAQDATGLVSSGSRHSPHVHRVAAIAQRLGIPCRVHVATGENTPDVQGAEDAGAEVIRHKAGYLNVLNARAREDAAQSGYTLIPFGVVCPEAVKQISGQVDNLPQEMKRLVVPVGSGISLSGILQGLQRIGRTVPVLGVCVGKDAIEVLDQYAPKDWRSTVELVKSPYKFEEHPKETHLGTLPLDPTYEAKCIPFLQHGDCLWSIGLRASAVEDENDTTQLPHPRWIVGDSCTIPDLCPDVQADLVFTCPPYYDLEVYSDNPQDLSTVGTYEEFVQSYRLILKHAIAKLKDNRFVCVVVGDIRDKKGFYRNFVGDTISACQDAGAKLYNEAILVTSVGSLPIRVGKQFSSGRKLGKTHQNVLVFCKGNPQKAVQDCGPVVVHIPDDDEEGDEEIPNPED